MMRPIPPGYWPIAPIRVSAVAEIAAPQELFGRSRLSHETYLKMAVAHRRKTPVETAREYRPIEIAIVSELFPDTPLRPVESRESQWDGMRSSKSPRSAHRSSSRTRQSARS